MSTKNVLIAVLVIALILVLVKKNKANAKAVAKDAVKTPTSVVDYLAQNYPNAA